MGKLTYINLLKETVKNLPNPYNFRSLTLDSKITSSEWIKAQKEWKRSGDSTKDVEEAFLKPPESGDVGKAWIILDDGKSVGIVGAQAPLYQWKFQERGEGMSHIGVIYVTWIHGHRYATRGVMSMLNLPIFPQKDFYAIITTRSNNLASKKTIQLLKAEPWGSLNLQDREWYRIRAPYWWNVRSDGRRN